MVKGKRITKKAIKRTGRVYHPDGEGVSFCRGTREEADCCGGILLLVIILAIRLLPDVGEEEG